MFRVSNPRSLVGRCVKIGLSIGLVTLVAACSSASNRFGPFDETNAAKDPGYDPNNNAVYTGSVDNNADTPDFDRDVASQPLNDPTRPNRQVADIPTGNNTIVVEKGQTVYSISRATGARVGDIIAINNLQPPHELKTGQTLVLPAGSTTRIASTPPPTIRPAAAPIVQTTVPGTHKVKHGQTLYSISRAYGYTPERVAAHNRIDKTDTLKVGQNLRIPGKNQVVNTSYTPPAKPAAPAVVKQQPPAPLAKAPAPLPETTRKTDLQPKAPASIPPMTGNKFRWPVKGRVISNYGTKQGGGRNDGINIAVPEGTSVKAAENGVIAYAGNELKGYGNLVLIRHANNWVTAYAHNKELFVRRGDTVKRGQIIAKAGNTGNVKTPQLHFEIRKGAQAVDPSKYLSPNNVAGN